MNWQLMLGILIVINTASIIFTKIAADKLPKKKSVGIFYQYLFCAAIAILYAFLTKETEIGPTLFLIGTVGLINAFGNYFQWQALGLSLSKTTLFFPLMEMATIFLAVIFLGEAILWTPQLIFGAGLCFLAMYLLRIPMKNSDNGETRKSLGKKWLVCTLLMISIVGIAGFLLKFFSFTVAKGTFLMGWYIGALLGTLPILLLEKSNPFKVTKETIFTIFPVSLAIWGALLALYWTYQLGGPVSFVLPLRGLAITLIPAFIGWQRFKEGKKFNREELCGFIVGIIGAIMILLR